MSTSISVWLRLNDMVSGGLRGASGALDGLRAHLNGANRQTTILDDLLGGIQGKLLALVGLVGGAGLVKEVINLNEQFENTQVKIAGTLRAYNLAATSETAKKQAGAAMEKIEEMAAKLPGETEEYITVFSTALPKAIEAGLTDVQSIADVTSNWMALAASNKIDAMQAGMDLYRVLAGQAGLDVRTWQVISSKVGMTTEQFNKMAKSNPQKGLEKLLSVMKDFDAQKDMAADTYSAKMGEFESHIKTIKRLAGEVLFEEAKKTLGDINEYLKNNRKQIVETAREWFQKLIPLFQKSVEAFKFLMDHLDEIVTLSATLAGIWTAGTLANSILNLINLFNTMKAAALAAAAATPAGAAGSTLVRVGTALGVTAATAGVGAFLMPSSAGSEQELEWEKKNREDAMTTMRRMEESREKFKLAVEPLANYGKYAGSEAAERAFAQAMAKGTKTSPLGEMNVDQLMQIAGDLRYNTANIEKYYKELVPKAKPSAAPEGRTSNNYDFRNSRFDIKQQFAEGFDPDRVAVAFSSDLARLGEQKVQSSYAPVFSMR